jgi:archaeal type IV pilus assembly protein PilA
MSKANQTFKQNDEAVSPVIGVILMVAITVVLAAVVFVLVSNLGEGSESAPNISFNKDSADQSLTVVQAEDATWGDFSVSPAGCTSPTTTEAVSAGDVIDCSTVTAPFTVTITHTPTNSLVYSTTFT